MTAQMLWNKSHYIRWNEFRRYPKQIEIPLDTFLSISALDMGIEVFSNTEKSAEIAGKISNIFLISVRPLLRSVEKEAMAEI